MMKDKFHAEVNGMRDWDRLFFNPATLQFWTIQKSGSYEITSRTFESFELEIESLPITESKVADDRDNWAGGFRAPGKRGMVATNPKGPKKGKDHTPLMNDYDEGRGYWIGATGDE